ncbi:MAG: hypothetical protein ACM3H9_05765, partial [Rhodospirillaceae bacterium]
VHVTRDGGKTWDNVTPKDLPEFARISLIEASPHQAGCAFVAANRYQRADRAPYVYRTDDYGRTWTKIVGGLPASDFARAIREDRKKAGLLYLGTEHGIYVSFDNGRAWQSLRLDLPVTPVHGIVSTEKDLVIGTHGRSFYILDNAAVLRQFTPGIAAEAVHLFDPPDAVRSVDRGVPVDYYLKSAAEKVSIEILDAKGQVVNSYSGVAAKEGDKPAGPPPDEEGFRPRAASVPVKAGMNRFVWDMRYAGAKDFPNMILWAGSTRGPIAPPGTYQVRLTASGETQLQSFTIARNPNTPVVTDADMAEQFALALQIRDKVTQADEAVIRIRSVKDQLADRLKPPAAGRDDKKPSKAALLGEALTTKLTAIEGEIYQYRNRSSQDPLNYPIKLNNKLAALQGVVEAGDGKPTRQSYEVFKELSSRLDAELAKLDAVLKSDLPPFNAEIAKKRLEPVK